MSLGPEQTEVEEPFLDQLASMGWKVITGSVDVPSVTGRADALADRVMELAKANGDRLARR